MRYRAKFGLFGWAWVALASFALLLRLSPRHHNAFLGIYALTWTVFAALKILLQVFIYWDLDSACLRERRLWQQRNIAWQDVTRVSAWNPKRPSSGALAIDYARSAPISDRGSVIANPEDHQQFLAALRRYAPQASFDVSFRHSSNMG